MLRFLELVHVHAHTHLSDVDTSKTRERILAESFKSFYSERKMAFTLRLSAIDRVKEI